MLQANDDEIGPNAITLYVEDMRANQQKELIEAENDDDKTRDDCMDTNTAAETDTATGTDTAAETDTTAETEAAAETDIGADMESDLADKYVEQPPIEKSSQVIEDWEDGLGLSKLLEFPSKKAIQKVVDRATFSECFRYVIKKSDRRRLVLRCCEESCK